MPNNNLKPIKGQAHPGKEFKKHKELRELRDWWDSLDKDPAMLKFSKKCHELGLPVNEFNLADLRRMLEQRDENPEKYMIVGRKPSD